MGQLGTIGGRQSSELRTVTGTGLQASEGEAGFQSLAFDNDWS